MPKLARLTLHLAPDYSEADYAALLALLSRHAPHGWEEADSPDGVLALTLHFTLPEACAECEAALAGQLPGLRLARDEVEQSNWLEAWKEFFTPVKAGEHFLVIAPWMDPCMENQRQETRRIPIIIEPKTAFGTGHHASTALCLEALSLLFAEGRIKKGMPFLDLGTGSGILAIGAAKLGLRGQALDVDPVAVDNALENRAMNGIAAADIEVARGGLEKARGPFALVMANILAAPLIEMAPDMAALKDENGGKPLLVLSGILASQADEVSRAYQAQGFGAPRRLEREEWVALIPRASA
ncbi:50S ribosomal protein L11 methyltransferase [Desulfovibrio sp. OttesenSCG-928-M16]|nr:50S ribosomal protein L11 methyltransferase [Desulfovibrio sp. OttesenSCG-928-M16]